MMQFTMIQKVAIWILPLLFGITVHEVAHGWVASRLGDKTAQRLGRLTLNPIKHIDWLGTVLVPFVLLLISPVVFGWAKPVPVTQQNLRHPRRDMALVALAGPLSNLIMAFIWGFIMKIGTWLMPVTSQIGVPLALMGQAGIFVNVMLMVLNLIPIPPLDGGRVVSNLLSPKAAYYFDQIERFGFLILVLLLFTRLINFILLPPFTLLYNLILTIFRLK